MIWLKGECVYISCLLSVCEYIQCTYLYNIFLHSSDCNTRFPTRGIFESTGASKIYCTIQYTVDNNKFKIAYKFAELFYRESCSMQLYSTKGTRFCEDRSARSFTRENLFLSEINSARPGRHAAFTIFKVRITF